METAMKTTLVKWGNSQGFRFPKELCKMLGIGLGAEAEIQVDVPNSKVTLTFMQPEKKFHRTRKVTIEELFEDYDGTYEPPTDWPTAGKEIDWGEPAGEEVW